MSSELLIKGFFTLLFSGMFAYAVFVRDDFDTGADTDLGAGKRYGTFIPGLLLPAVIAVLFVLAYPVYGAARTFELMLSTWFGVFLHISIYYLLLLAFLPMLRRKVSARACAMLWMIPNYLYLTQHRFMGVDRPALIINADFGLLKILVAIWLAGFCGIMIFKLAEHFIMRRRLLRHARPLTNEAALEIWRSELEDANFKKPKLRVVISGAASTPLSIGFFRRTIRVVLPEKTYTDEELRLIFRHEIVHISREDSSNKFFLVFCTALCWFNPFMWKAMKKSAEDIELSCDETVLLGCSEGMRKKYAELILDASGSAKGFTTCLSSGFAAMKYRLENIIVPGKKSSGALIMGLVFFILSMTCGYISLSYDSRPGSEIIFEKTGVNAVTPDNISFSEIHDRYYAVKSTDGEALTEYISGLTFSRMTGSYSFASDDRMIILMYRIDTDTAIVRLKENMLSVYLLDDDSSRCDYICDTPPDWDYIRSLLIFP